MAAADRVLDRIDRRLSLLSDHAELGPARDDVRAGLRQLTSGAYLVFYQVEGDEVLIVRVTHGARDLRELL
jgi:toxin ParE1/3/4